MKLDLVLSFLMSIKQVCERAKEEPTEKGFPPSYRILAIMSEDWGDAWNQADKAISLLSNWPRIERLREAARAVESSPTDEPIEDGEEVILRVSYGDYIALQDALKDLPKELGK